MTFKRILVGTDGSDTAMRAVDHAARLAGKLGASLIVMHALPKGRKPPGRRERVTASYDIGTSILRDASAWYGEQLDVRSVLREGPAADALVAAAGEEDADLLVVGNRGLGRRRVPIGNVPARVIHRAPGTVLVVHTTDAVEGEPYRKLLIATGGSPAAARAAEVGGALARAVGAEVRVVTVGAGDRAPEVLADAARWLPPGTLGRTVVGDPAGRIVEVAEDEGCDLIVIGTRSTGGARRLVPGILGGIARRASCHVLVVKAS